MAKFRVRNADLWGYSYIYTLVCVSRTGFYNYGNDLSYQSHRPDADAL
jgi:hypothetical protein